MRRVVALLMLGMIGTVDRLNAADPPPMVEAGPPKGEAGAPKGEAGPPKGEAGAPAIRVGDSASRVRQQLGAPDRIARQVLRTHYLEHWTYLQPQLLRVILLGVPGTEPTVRELSGVGAENPKKISTPR
ncbi:hypothetical protein [Tuwongella immobilis]|uniref:Uncharacterized protein n=1 Tax=Tuwongella immobilis TaxID=692036 RepID=A0A6C2YUQ6_9BACT|nr:hypothetical protein [Tuwongella immobilis]VIP05226.1 unnamed protein product [Tuwongella immobilis]VTS07808.1 unnamed protein product [Tuwongella immobilis]